MLKKTFDPDNHPPHPGEILREDILPRLNMTRKKFASHLGISPRALADLLAERKPVTPELALRLATVVGYGARYWLGHQTQHDLWQIENLRTPANVRPIQWNNPTAVRTELQALHQAP